jgi:hypothetical protein
MSILEIFIIITLSIFQSIFGVGLLVFGTPIFLQLGYGFFEVLNILLPFSIVISFLQLITKSELTDKFVKNFVFFCIPLLILSLVILENIYDQINIILIVAIIMVSFSTLNILVSKGMLRFRLNQSVRSLSLALLGLLHGFTNLGGGFLALISSNIGNSKLEVRTNIAFGYLVFGAIQILYVNIFIQSMDLDNLFLIIIPIICFFISQIIFNKISGKLFPILINYMVLIYGIFLLF